MNDILSELKSILENVPVIGKTYIGEPVEAVPASNVSFVNIEDNGEFLETLGLYRRRTYSVIVRVGAIVPQIYTEAAVMKCIDLSQTVEAAIDSAGNTLNGKVKLTRLKEISPPGFIAIDDNRFARAREMIYEFVKIESLVD